MHAKPAVMIWCNGILAPWEERVIHLPAHGLHGAAAVFEGARAWETKRGTEIFRLDDHVTRLRARAAEREIDVAADLAEAVREVVRVNSMKNACVLLYACRTPGWGSQRRPANAAVVAFEPSTAPADAAPVVEARLTPGFAAREFSREGEIPFVVRGKVLHAPPGSSVMANTMVTLAKHLGYEVREQALAADAGEEAFLTSSCGLAPIRPGPLAKAFQGLFTGETEDRWGWLQQVELWPPPQFADAVA